MDYQTLVFRNLDKAPFGCNYCMVTVWPNWESYIPEIGEIGFLTYDSVTAGVDTYYDRDKDTIVKYSIINDRKNLFASKYQFYLPTEEEFAKEVEKEKNSYDNNR